jgi:biopolymer transport protein TolR
MTMEGAGGGLKAEINITPMIDVLLVLLIILMVIVPTISKGEAAVVPHGSPVFTPPDPDAIVLEVLTDNNGAVVFRINQGAVSRVELPVRLSSIFARHAQRVLFVKGDGQLSFSRIAEVIDLSHAAGADRVCLMTPKTTAS